MCSPILNKKVDFQNITETVSNQKLFHKHLSNCKENLAEKRLHKKCNSNNFITHKKQSSQYFH